MVVYCKGREGHLLRVPMRIILHPHYGKITIWEEKAFFFTVLLVTCLFSKGKLHYAYNIFCFLVLCNLEMLSLKRIN